MDFNKTQKENILQLKAEVNSLKSMQRISNRNILILKENANKISRQIILEDPLERFENENILRQINMDIKELESRMVLLKSIRVDIEGDAGVEYVGFGKKKLMEMKRFMLNHGLDILRKRYNINEIDIFVESINGFDTVRIEGGKPTFNIFLINVIGRNVITFDIILKNNEITELKYNKDSKINDFITIDKTLFNKKLVIQSAPGNKQHHAILPYFQNRFVGDYYLRDSYDDILGVYGKRTDIVDYPVNNNQVMMGTPDFYVKIGDNYIFDTTESNFGEWVYRSGSKRFASYIHSRHPKGDNYRNLYIRKQMYDYFGGDGISPTEIPIIKYVNMETEQLISENGLQQNNSPIAFLTKNNKTIIKTVNTIKFADNIIATIENAEIEETYIDTIPSNTSVNALIDGEAPSPGDIVYTISSTFSSSIEFYGMKNARFVVYANNITLNDYDNMGIENFICFYTKKYIKHTTINAPQKIWKSIGIITTLYLNGTTGENFTRQITDTSYSTGETVGYASEITETDHKSFMVYKTYNTELITIEISNGNENHSFINNIEILEFTGTFTRGQSCYINKEFITYTYPTYNNAWFLFNSVQIGKTYRNRPSPEGFLYRKIGLINLTNKALPIGYIKEFNLSDNNTLEFNIKLEDFPIYLDRYNFPVYKDLMAIGLHRG